MIVHIEHRSDGLLNSSNKPALASAPTPRKIIFDHTFASSAAPAVQQQADIVPMEQLRAMLLAFGASGLLQDLIFECDRVVVTEFLVDDSNGRLRLDYAVTGSCKEQPRS